MLKQRPRSLVPTLLPPVPWLQAPPIHQEGGMYARQKQAASQSIALVLCMVEPCIVAMHAEPGPSPNPNANP